LVGRHSGGLATLDERERISGSNRIAQLFEEANNRSSRVRCYHCYPIRGGYDSGGCKNLRGQIPQRCGLGDDAHDGKIGSIDLHLVGISRRR
jgi:hypothetical protein